MNHGAHKEKSTHVWNKIKVDWYNDIFETTFTTTGLLKLYIVQRNIVWQQEEYLFIADLPYYHKLWEMIIFST